MRSAAGPASAFAKARNKSARRPASDYRSGAMLIEDVRQHPATTTNDEGPDLATGALLVYMPVPVML